MNANQAAPKDRDNVLLYMRNAPLLRKHIVRVYGGALINGGDTAIYRHAMRLVRRLALLSGQTIEQALSDLRSDIAAQS
jgi:hypothetical protein